MLKRERNRTTGSAAKCNVSSLIHTHLQTKTHTQTHKHTHPSTSSKQICISRPSCHSICLTSVCLQLSQQDQKGSTPATPGTTTVTPQPSASHKRARPSSASVRLVTKGTDATVMVTWQIYLCVFRFCKAFTQDPGWRKKERRWNRRDTRTQKSWICFSVLFYVLSSIWLGSIASFSLWHLHTNTCRPR